MFSFLIAHERNEIILAVQSNSTCMYCGIVLFITEQRRQREDIFARQRILEKKFSKKNFENLFHAFVTRVSRIGVELNNTSK